MLYHSPASPAYDVTVAEVWFRDEDTAGAAGFARWTAASPSAGRSSATAVRAAAAASRAPPSGLASNDAVPPWSSACWATSARPSPEPECDAVDPRENRSKTDLAFLLGDTDTVVVDRDLHSGA